MYRSNIDLSVLIGHYEVHNRTEGKSPRTVQWYNEVLSMIYGWLEVQGMSTILNTIGEMEVRGSSSTSSLGPDSRAWSRPTR